MAVRSHRAYCPAPSPCVEGLFCKNRRPGAAVGHHVERREGVGAEGRRRRLRGGLARLTEEHPPFEREGERLEQRRRLGLLRQQQQ